MDDNNIPKEVKFFFKTDHTAVRGNKDYSDLLKYIINLENKKVRALKDIEDLAHAQHNALNDPLAFVEELKSGKTIFPPHQTIADVPEIDWNKYGIETSPDDKKDINSCIKIRGRKFNDNKPETFNQLWSCEEQKRLEELLEIYPEEKVEANRYKKIAKALGTRTPIQIMCRVQKYFAKLAQARLPIPGRAPKRVSGNSKKSLFYKKSTFFPQLHVPVKMEDFYDSSDSKESSSQEAKPYKSAIDLLKAAKEQRVLDDTSPIFQIKSMCIGCQKTGFLGARWTDDAGTVYCTDCVVKLLPAEKLTPIRLPI